jgi:putative oxidoreductase
MKFLHLNFLPRSPDVALLLLRVWFGTTLLWLHGWNKVANFGTMREKFPDVLGIGSGAANLALAAFGEVVCAALVVVGLFTRIAALGSAITMFVAFWVAHEHRLRGPGNVELAFMFLGGFLALVVAGAGRYSIDARIGAKS